MIFEKEGKELSRAEFEKLTGAVWTHQLVYSYPVYLDLLKKGASLRKKQLFSKEQLWLGAYYKKEISSNPDPDVAIRWIDPLVGWGVFALRPFKKMEFIAIYAGEIRKRKAEDQYNSYCFEYVLIKDRATAYTIDASLQGNVARYINHSEKGKLTSALATVGELSYVLLYVKEPIAKGEQLCYDYGSDYWSKRCPPVSL